MDHTGISRPAVLIGARVRDRRLENNLNEDDVSRAMGCEVSHLRAAEAGEINFTPQNIVDLCSVLRVLPSWFFEDVGEPT